MQSYLSIFVNNFTTAYRNLSHTMAFQTFENIEIHSLEIR